MPNLKKYTEMTKSKKVIYKFYKTTSITTSTITLSRWGVNVLKGAVVNVSILGSHSTRSATTSKYKTAELSSK